jgi:heme/copper-type cytochrome/quinol oxidase subunit 2
MYMLWHSYPKILVAAFFILLIFFGVFFVLNLFLAVIRNNFQKESDKVENDRKKFKRRM